jgi:hypothetical protein
MKELFQYFWTFRFWIVLIGLTGGGLGFAYPTFSKRFNIPVNAVGLVFNKTERNLVQADFLTTP